MSLVKPTEHSPRSGRAESGRAERLLTLGRFRSPLAAWLQMVTLIAGCLQPASMTSAVYIDDSGAPGDWLPLNSGDIEPPSGPNFSQQTDSEGNPIGDPAWRVDFFQARDSGQIVFWTGGTFTVDGATIAFAGQWVLATKANLQVVPVDTDHDGLPDSLDDYPGDVTNNSFYWSGGQFTIDNIYHAFRSGWYSGHTTVDSNGTTFDNGNSVPKCLMSWFDPAASHPGVYLQKWGGVQGVIVNGQRTDFPPCGYWTTGWVDADQDHIPAEFDPDDHDPLNNTYYSFPAGGGSALCGVQQCINPSCPGANCGCVFGPNCWCECPRSIAGVCLGGCTTHEGCGGQGSCWKWKHCDCNGPQCDCVDYHREHPETRACFGQSSPCPHKEPGNPVFIMAVDLHGTHGTRRSSTCLQMVGEQRSAGLYAFGGIDSGGTWSGEGVSGSGAGASYTGSTNSSVSYSSGEDSAGVSIEIFPENAETTTLPYRIAPTFDLEFKKQFRSEVAKFMGISAFNISLNGSHAITRWNVDSFNDPRIGIATADSYTIGILGSVRGSEALPLPVADFIIPGVPANSYLELNGCNLIRKDTNDPGMPPGNSRRTSISATGSVTQKVQARYQHTLPSGPLSSCDLQLNGTGMGTVSAWHSSDDTSMLTAKLALTPIHVGCSGTITYPDGTSDTITDNAQLHMFEGGVTVSLHWTP